MAIQLDDTVTIQDLWNAIVSGRQAFGTYAELLLNDLRPVGAIAEVEITDGGTHIDPVSGLLVANHGVFRKTVSGWTRMANVDDKYPLVVVALADAIVAKDAAVAAKVAAEAAKVAAEAAAVVAIASGNLYASVALGVAGTVDGDPFLVQDGAGNADLYKNVAGVGTTQNFKVMGAAGVLAAIAAAAAAAATVGRETGNVAARGGQGGIDLDTVTPRATAYHSAIDKGLVAENFFSARRAKMRKATVVWGHSAVAGSGVVLAGAAVKPTSGIAGSFPRKLEYILQQYNPAHMVSNRGQSAQKSPEIAARMGAIPMLITLTVGILLPVATVAACTSSPAVGGVFNGPSAQRNNSPDIYAGTIAGQACLLKAVDNNSSNPKQYTIEQVGGTGDLTINPGTPFWLDPLDTDYAVNIFWATKNDGTDLQLSIDMTAAMVQKLPVAERRYIVIGDWPFATGQDGNPGTPSEDLGTAAHTNMLAKNAKLRDIYGSNFIDPYKFFRGEYPYDGSVYPSVFQLSGDSPVAVSHDYAVAGDWKNTLGLLPRTYMSIHLGGVDLSHLHEISNWWLAKLVDILYYKPRGWR